MFNIVCNYSKHVFFLSLLFLMVTANKILAQECDFELIMERVQKDQRAGIRHVGTIDEWVSAQNVDGSWNDVKYGKLPASIGTGTVGDHVGRLWHIAAAASEPTHSRYNNEQYKQAV